MSDGAGIEALVFDVYGTVVDWRAPVIEAAAEVAAEKGIEGDWAAFAADWKAGYSPPMAEINAGAAWMNVDEIMRRRLDEIADGHGLGGLSDQERRALTEAWSRSRPWPDSLAALERLRRQFILVTLSNCAFRWLVAMAKGAGLPFDVILTSEIARAYKPAPKIYEMAIEFMGGNADTLCMVACHNYDLAAAQSHGMKTAFLPRQEDGPGQTRNQAPEGEWDHVAVDLGGLADQLGC